MSPSDKPTLRHCPLCELCPYCHGKQELWCGACRPTIHLIDCSHCKACGLCDGTHMVTEEVRAKWIQENRHA